MFFSSSPASGLNVYAVGAVHSPFQPNPTASDPKGKISYDTPPSREADPESGLITTFSTVGPTFDLNLTPHVCAPGKEIVGVASYYQDGDPSKPQTRLWNSADGTSQATPLTAGAIAVYLAVAKAKGAPTDPKSVREVFMATSALIKARSGSSGNAYESVAIAGSGLVQLENALTSNTAVSPSFNLLNDTANYQSTKVITIKNQGSKSQMYTLTHVPADTVYAWNGVSLWSSCTKWRRH